MLYKNTEDAICRLLNGNPDKKSGQIILIFDLDNLAVSASFTSEDEEVKDLYLQPSEFLVKCQLHAAEELGVAIRAAAFNAVAGLAETVDIEQEKGAPLTCTAP